MVDPITRKINGHQCYPSLGLDGMILIPQLSLLTGIGVVRLDFAWGRRVQGSNQWSVLELDGSGHDSSSNPRTTPGYKTGGVALRSRSDTRREPGEHAAQEDRLSHSSWHWNPPPFSEPVTACSMDCPSTTTVVSSRRLRPGLHTNDWAPFSAR